MLSLLAIPALTNGELVFHLDTLKTDQALNFRATPERSMLQWRSADTICSLKVDFFYTHLDGGCLAIGCNAGIRIGSSEAMYLSKRSFNQHDLSKPVQLTSVSFDQSDTGSRYTFYTNRCHNLKGFYGPSTNGMPDYRDFESKFFIIRTAQNVYVLLKIRYSPVNIITPNPEIPTGYPPANDRIFVESYLQTDGTLDFSGIGRMASAVPVYRVGNTIAPSGNRSAVFSPAGKRIKGSIKTAGVVVVRDARGTRCVVPAAGGLR
jgi:hypothetical protein